MKRRSLVLALPLWGAMIGIVQAGPGNPDIAFAMGMLWRVQDNVCPGMSFDPAALAATTKPKPMSPAALKGTYRRDFDKGFELAGEAIAGADAGDYCQSWVLGFFGGTRDIFGHVKSVPASPAPGLKIQ